MIFYILSILCAVFGFWAGSIGLLIVGLLEEYGGSFSD